MSRLDEGIPEHRDRMPVPDERYDEMLAHLSDKLYYWSRYREGSPASRKRCRTARRDWPQGRAVQKCRRPRGYRHRRCPSNCRGQGRTSLRFLRLNLPARHRMPTYRPPPLSFLLTYLLRPESPRNISLTPTGSRHLRV